MAGGRLPALWAAKLAPLRRRRLTRRLAVDAHEAHVVVRDLLGGVLALEVPVQEALESVPPDRAADREAGVSLHRGPLAQPVVHLLVVRATAQDHADHAVATVAAGGLGDQLTVLLRV